MCAPTTRVCYQENTPHATQCAYRLLRLRYIVKQIHLMQHGLHVDTYNYSTLSSKYTLCSAGTCGHLQLQYVVKQIHLMQRGVQHLDQLYIYIGNLLLTNTSACACPFNKSTSELKSSCGPFTSVVRKQV